MLNKVTEDLKNYLRCKKIYNVILSISGGIDSIVLLAILVKIRKSYKELNISLYHINYNMHLNSNKSYKLCQSLSYEYKLTFYSDDIKISNSNFESKARTIRYDNLKNIVSKHAIQLILTAHHYDDQIETLIMKHEENADWVSFLGIREKYNTIYRPFLDVHKKHIYQYAKKNNLIWIDDTSNDLQIYKRNRIRFLIKKNTYSKKFIIKLLKKHILAKKNINYFNKVYRENISQLILEQSNNNLKVKLTCLNLFNTIEFKLFINKILLEYFNIKSIFCSRSHWINLYKFLLKSKQGSKYIISRNIVVIKDRGMFILFIDHTIDLNFSEKLQLKKINWYGTTFIASQNIKMIDSSKYITIPKDVYKEGLFITHWRYGDKIKTRNSTKKISDVFINNKISNYDKKYYPIIRNRRDQVIWIPDLINKYSTECKDSIYISWKL